MYPLEQQIAEVANQLYSKMAALGYFANTEMHEPKSAPQGDLTVAVFVQQMQPESSASGLDATSFRIEYTARIYKPFKSAPEGLIDINIGMAAAAVIGALSGDFDLAGTVRNVVLLGGNSAALGAVAGYQTIDSTVYRIMDITIPVVINDAFDQGA
ncbi:MAG: hypothetical protein ABWY81_11030 [Jiangellaceae bacterium]